MVIYLYFNENFTYFPPKNTFRTTSRDDVGRDDNLYIVNISKIYCELLMISDAF